ncbi:MAG: hypothetical protein ABMA13_17520 [Chthoniobacteraceae bacterium]
MNKTSLITALIGLTTTAAFAFDSDPGYGPRYDYTPGARNPAPKAKISYKPTMRYFGKGYMVTYRFVQWDSKLNRSGLTTFENQQYQITAASVQTVAGIAPRVTHYYSPRPQSPAVAPETRTAGGAPELPAIGERVRKP